MGKDVTVIDIEIPRSYGPQAREAIAQDVMDKIVERTLSSKDKNNKPFPKYDKEYSKSLDFKIAGKSKKVNLRLSGDMLAGLDLVRHEKGLLRVGYGRGHEERGKAEGNILGTYGQKTPIVGKKRDFLGLPKSDLKKILNKYPEDDKKSLLEQVATTQATKSLAEEISISLKLKREGDDVQQ